MNEKVKQFIEKINMNEGLRNQFFALSEKAGGNTDREEVIKQQVLPFAKTCGYDLTIEDFLLTEDEMDESELQAVSGGLVSHTGSGRCECPGIGEGQGYNSQYESDFGCGCIVCGVGANEEDVSKTRCLCWAAGSGSCGD